MAAAAASLAFPGSLALLASPGSPRSLAAGGFASPGSLATLCMQTLPSLLFGRIGFTGFAGFAGCSL